MENSSKSKLIPLLAAIAMFVSVSTTANASIALFDYGFNIDGTTIFNPGPLPGVDDSGFDFVTGLGTIDVTISGTGLHYVGGFFDHEIDEPINTFFNEVGFASGAPAAGQSWEIDDPGFVFGDIDLNLIAGTLDNSVGTAFPDDVSMAMGWDFALALGEQATITFALSETSPLSGFFLEHNDPDSSKSIFLSGALGITGTPAVIPVPAAVWLFGSGLVGLIGFSRRKAKA